MTIGKSVDFKERLGVNEDRINLVAVTKEPSRAWNGKSLEMIVDATC